MIKFLCSFYMFAILFHVVVLSFKQISVVNRPSYNTRFYLTPNNMDSMFQSTIPATTPSLEIARYEAYSFLRKRLQNLLLNEGCISRRGWIRAFERWQCNSKLHEGSVTGDPILPSTDYIDNDFMTDLSKLDNMTVPLATKVAKQLQMDSVRLSNKIKQLDITLQEKRKQSPEKVPCVIVAYRRHDICLSLSSYAQERYSCLINYATLQRLQQRWLAVLPSRISNTLNSNDMEYTALLDALTKPTSALSSTDTSSSPSIPAVSSPPPSIATRPFDSFIQPPSISTSALHPLQRAFLEDVYSLLMRYQTLEGPGLQGALPITVFNTLKKDIDVETECFASPLNAHLPSYCSVFPDIDSLFGSLGSFLQYFPSSGSFQINPPFVQALMLRTISHVEALLSASAQPLSFILFVPAWMDDPHWLQLQQSRFMTATLIIEAAEHTYRDGMLHCRRETLRPAAFNTGVVFLQNEAGKARWPMTAEMEATIRTAYSQCKPDEYLLKRQQAEGFYLPKNRLSDSVQ